jgi:RND family efflux transporter MFP subunit
MRKAVVFFLGAILLFTQVFFLSGCRKSEPQAAAPGGGGAGGRGGGGEGAANLPPKQVKVTQASERTVPRLVEAPGTLTADEQATLSFKVAGRLAQLRVDLGTPVRKGQIIGQLETQDFNSRLQQSEAALQQARVRLGLSPLGENDNINIETAALVRQAQAVLQEAKLDLERTRQLVSEGVQPRAELDRADSAFKVADSRYQDAMEEVRNRQAVLLQRRAELQSAKQQLAETTLYAPFDGSIREKRANLGEYLTAGTPVVNLVRLHPLRFRVEVPERDAQGLRIGQPVKVTVEGEFESAPGRVARISPAIQEQSRTLIIEAAVDNQKGRLRPGSFAKAAIHTATTSGVVTVPPDAVVSFAGIQKVFGIKDGKAVEHNVVIGRRETAWVEVVEGLKANDTIILAPGNLVPGQPVIVGK